MSAFSKTVIIASLGYLIDMFDFFLFNALRIHSLSELGLSGDALTEAGIYVLNMQLLGLLIGSYLSGVLGDRWGRKSGLIISILFYSIGSILSAYTESVEQFGFFRFITGLGIAGELGQGLTLICEKLKTEKRGYGTFIFFSLGFLGVILAGIVSEYIYWRHAFIVGGVAGLIILFLRGSIEESELFIDILKNTNNSNNRKLPRGGLKLILSKPSLLRPFLGGIFLIAPAVFTPQIIWTLSPEIAKGFGITDSIKPQVTLALGFSVFILADFLAVMTSETIKSRRNASLAFLILSIAFFTYFVVFPPTGKFSFYIFTCSLGLTSGVWIVALTWIAEHFATNIRSTVSTVIPNLSRALAIPMNFAYGYLKDFGSINAVIIIAYTIFILALIGLLTLKETYGKSLDFLENNHA